MKKIMDISGSIIDKQKQVSHIIDGSVEIATVTMESLEALVNQADSSSQLVEQTIEQVQQQLGSSNNIQLSMQDLIDDTRSALAGSASNVELGEQLMIQLRLRNE